MRSGAALSLVAALLFGALAAFLARSMILAGSAGPGERATRTVVVAAQPIPFGAALARENLKEVAWPVEAVPDGSFVTVGAILEGGRRLSLAALGPNEPVLAGKVTLPNGRASLSTQIDEGMRAVSVRVDEVRGVAGFVLPGDRVDVILTRGEGGVQDGAAYADILLQNAKVLAVDQLANDRQDKPTVARAVTLELTVQQAQKVVLAQGIGRLSLVLRQAGEAADRPAARVTAADLGGDAVPAGSKVADLEKEIAELRRAVELAKAAPQDGGAQKMAEMEARLREEMLRSRMLAAPPPAARPPDKPIVSVIRNGSKREDYPVISER